MKLSEKTEPTGEVRSQPKGPRGGKPRKASSKGAETGPDHILPGLHSLVVPAESLHLDPANARLHSERNLRTIASSLSRFGQRKPLVVQKKGSIVIAGNGTLEAARSLGWKEVAVVFVDDDPSTATGYAIADNRTAELAEWDAKSLRQLLDSIEDIPAAELGFDPEELQSLIEATGLPPASDVDFPEFGDDAADKFKNIECPECGHEFHV